MGKSTCRFFYFLRAKISAREPGKLGHDCSGLSSPKPGLWSAEVELLRLEMHIGHLRLSIEPIYSLCMLGTDPRCILTSCEVTGGWE